MRILARSESFSLGHEFENVVLVDRNRGSQRAIAHHYGDPTCGLIGPNDEWFVVGGEGVTFFDPRRGVAEFFRRGCPPHERSQATWFVHAMRLDGPDMVRILFDPWSDYASVWALRASSLELLKIRDGPSLANRAYQENVAF